MHIPVAHTVPQRPQFIAWLVVLLSQPLDGLPSQSPNPLLQLYWQTPDTHAGVTFVRAPAMHVSPQAPQWVSDADVPVSHPSAGLPLQLLKPVAHAATPHTPAVQV